MSAPRRARPRLDPERLRQFQARLLAWFALQGRKLPWRRTRDPYRVLVSEVMLQQTQVDRVQGYYRRFLRVYPTVQDLAAAHPDRVRESWAGLGYYARARNLQAAARAIVDRHAGRFPTRLEELQDLPGVGRYTAGALLSFAYGRPAPVLDTNVRRILTRVFVRRRSRHLDRRLWALAEAVIPPGDAWAFNQALMDLGALVCRARRPDCSACPVAPVCGTGARAARSREAASLPSDLDRKSP